VPLRVVRHLWARTEFATVSIPNLLKLKTISIIYEDIKCDAKCKK